jgi:site-specific DNA-methyltransferase (adenine-specific)
VEKHGTGALNIDACRVEWAGLEDAAAAAAAVGYGNSMERGTITCQTNLPTVYKKPPYEPDKLAGRWPANVCLDELAAMVLDEQSGELSSGFMAAGTEREGIGYHGGLGCTVRNDTHGDIGGASRFFYVAKPSREERDYGCVGLTRKTAGECTSRTEGSDGLNNPRAGAGRTGGGRNFHPTVKPVELMRWLVKLVTPPNGTVLDPFLGSGTTGMACRYELRNFIGIEREAEYLEIAERRIAAVAPLFTESA